LLKWPLTALLILYVEQLYMAINALSLTIFPAQKVAQAEQGDDTDKGYYNSSDIEGLRGLLMSIESAAQSAYSQHLREVKNDLSG
jgi:hypothetical protein